MADTADTNVSALDDTHELAERARAVIAHLREERTRRERQLDAVQIRLEIIDDVLARLAGTRRRRRLPVAVDTVSETDTDLGFATPPAPPAA
jgi:hypothetical protein